ncbi:U3 small nucleolar RNA-associated protein 15 homolog [Microplitis mediator]|uniref:U3 small nucleolar RNA-associated protein 15 homolog n=1 Tax=Microplitis mediator TaxID=375433 RepID=UPI002557BC04|nr:U3 small nucleolar RNA-associated protein 15 homolog [Microplitis mediator]
MASFKKTNVKVFAKIAPDLTPDSIYWKKFSPPVLVKEFGAIDYVDFSRAEPQNFAVTCSVRVQVYNTVTKLVTKNLTKFKEFAYGGSFRADGKLICAGGQESVVRLFDVSTKSLLRLFTGHQAPVHRTFFTVDGRHITSFSDDKSAAVWDIPGETQLMKFEEHTDYVRAGTVSPISPDIFLSGSYDKTVKMYDTRTNKSVFTVNHGAPVESIIFLPSGGIFISAGGTEMKVWDALAGGKLLARVSQHHKTITCLAMASNGHKILSGSLDRHVNIYDVGTYKAIHTFDYPNSVLSLGISANDETIVAGMVDGLISIRRREHDDKIEDEKRTKISHRRRGLNLHSSSIDVVVPHENKEMMSKHDTFLRKFQYSKALDCVMVNFVVNKNPHVTVALLQELTRRQGLPQALAARDGKSLVNILKFIIRHIGSPRFSRVLLHVTHILMDLYEDTIDELSPESRTMFALLHQKLNEEEDLITSMTELQGALYMILSGAESTQSTSIKEPQILEPSSAAQKNLIHNIS